MLDEVEIRKAISILIGEGNLFECRIINSTRGEKQYSGYFKSSDSLIDNLKRQDLGNSNVYIVLNKIKEECYGRKQAENFQMVKTSTKDDDILVREWILVDLDPKRPTDTSATDEQVVLAKKKMIEVCKYLQDMGFEKPIIGFSGNGFHLLYKVKLLNQQANSDLVKKFLYALDTFFSDGIVDVDISVYNASRVCKLYGTVARKGRNTKSQPHRMSKILYVPPTIEPVPRTYIEKVADSVIEERIQPSRYNNYIASDFDIEEWMQKYGINYRIANWSNGTKYILDCCPFDSSHRGKDAVIFKRMNGALGFKCFHNSCSDKTWRDVRLLYEPDAYTKKWENQKRIQYKPNSERLKEQALAPKIVEEKDRPVFLTAQNILDKPTIEQSFVKTGINEIDKRMRGLMKGHVSVWSGLRGSAKSTLLSQIALNAVDSGCTVIAYSGELNEKNFMRWMNQQAAGHNTEPSAYPGYYNTPLRIQKRIAKWLGERFYLYDNAYGNNFEAVIAQIEEQIKKTHADLVILDNLMAFNISSLGYTKWDAQSAFVWRLHELAMEYTTHIAFVAHPKKAAGFLRFDDISGTADLGNAVDDAFIVHRNNEDFKRLSKAMFQWRDDNAAYDGTNVIEIVKDRDGGNQDVFIPLYYEARSKRLKNSDSENVVYGWESDEDGFVSIPEGEDNPFT